MYRFLALAAAAVVTMALAVYAQSTRPANPAGHAFYSAEQAERGKTLYGQNCSTCHLPTLKGNCSSSDRSYASPLNMSLIDSIAAQQDRVSQLLF